MGKKHISPETVKRIIVYCRYLEMFQKKGVKIISSKDVTVFLGINASQFRKDLSFFGEFGKRGVGYDVNNLLNSLKAIIGLEQKVQVIVVGVGKLGAALIGYPGFSKLNIEITAAFDKDFEKIGRKIENLEVLHIKKVESVVKKNNIKIAVLCVPAEEAQKVADLLVGAGIQSILNFAPTYLDLPKNIYLNNVDMASELGSLIFKLK
jgi:redox-sensing transcriptional repressor